MNRCAYKFVAVADYLPDANCVADLNRRCARRAYVLLHGQQNFVGHFDSFNGQVGGYLAVIDFNSASDVLNGFKNALHMGFAHIIFYLHFFLYIKSLK